MKSVLAVFVGQTAYIGLVTWAWYALIARDRTMASVLDAGVGAIQFFVLSRIIDDHSWRNGVAFALGAGAGTAITMTLVGGV